MTTTTLPSIGNLGMQITIKSCDGKSVNNVINLKNALIKIGDIAVPGIWVESSFTTNSKTFKLVFDDEKQ